MTVVEVYDLEEGRKEDTGNFMTSSNELPYCFKVNKTDHLVITGCYSSSSNQGLSCCLFQTSIDFN